MQKNNTLHKYTNTHTYTSNILTDTNCGNSYVFLQFGSLDIYIYTTRHA